MTPSPEILIHLILAWLRVGTFFKSYLGDDNMHPGLRLLVSLDKYKLG